MNTVNILNQDGATILLMNAMCDAMPDNVEDITKHFNMLESEAQVQVFVNGVEVDYLKALGVAVDRVVNKLDDLVLEKAQELVAASGVHALQRTITDAERELNHQLRQAQKANRK